MTKKAIIIFAKNPVKGFVKTRLSKDIGEQKALEVYRKLLKITERETLRLKDTSIYPFFTHSKEKEYWTDQQQYIQEKGDLGERMLSAFTFCFNKGHQEVIGIGTDLPELNYLLIEEAFGLLSKFDTVFGPAEDGGYYLLGMNQLFPFLFENKPWSTSFLLEETLKELKEKGFSSTMIKTLNDIDTLEDLSKIKLNQYGIDL